jgi:hypothetical protein
VAIEKEAIVRLNAFAPLVIGALVTFGVPSVARGQEPIDCGPGNEKHDIVKHDRDQPVPLPSAGKSMVVIVLGGSFTKSYQQKLAVNGHWRAVLKENQYSFVEVDPGIVRLCWGGRGVKRDESFLVISARPGETYYVRGTVRAIDEVKADEGQKLLRKKTYVTYEVKS